MWSRNGLPRPITTLCYAGHGDGPEMEPPDPTVVSDGIGINISSGHVDIISELRFVLAEQDS